MSFGIGSEIEGASEMETFLDNLYEGIIHISIFVSVMETMVPVISTAGLPSCSDYVFSSGAVLTTEVARDLVWCTSYIGILFFLFWVGEEK